MRGWGPNLKLQTNKLCSFQNNWWIDNRALQITCDSTTKRNTRQDFGFLQFCWRPQVQSRESSPRSCPRPSQWWPSSSCCTRLDPDATLRIEGSASLICHKPKEEKLTFRQIKAKQTNPMRALLYFTGCWLSELSTCYPWYVTNLDQVSSVLLNLLMIRI